MESRWVIADSDDDSSSLSAETSPQKDAPVVTNGIASELNATPPAALQPPLRLGTGSTDSVLFQRIYNSHCDALSIVSTNQSTRQLSPRLPELDERIINQRMSSSVSQESIKKLKRSKTMNVSSVTSISEPTTSNRKAKRAKSMKVGSDETQVTSPGQSKELQQKNDGNGDMTRDEWEFPGSSALDTSTAILRTEKLEKANASKKIDEAGLVKNVESTLQHITSNNRSLEAGTGGLKPDGGTRRTKTIGAGFSSSPPYEEPKRRAKDDIELGVERKKRKTRQGGDGELLPMLPKPKRNKRGPSVNGDALYNASVAVTDEPQLPRLSAFQISSPHKTGPEMTNAIVNESSSVQVPRSISQELRAQLSNCYGNVANDGSADTVSMVKATNSNDTSSGLPLHKSPTIITRKSSQNTTTQQLEISSIRDANSGGVSSIVPSFDKGFTSMVIIQDTLTSSQKKEYKLIDMTSSADSHRHSLPDMMEPVKGLKFSDASSTIPNDTPHRDGRQVSPPLHPTSASCQLSSPPSALNTRRKVVRSKTDVSRPYHPSSPQELLSSAIKANKNKLTRRKTIGHFDREASVDELSLSQPIYPNSPVHIIHTVSIEPLNDKKTRGNPTVSSNQSTKRKSQDDHLQSSQDFGLVTEMYQPRLSARRSKSMSARADIIANEEFAKGLPMKRKRSKGVNEQELVGMRFSDMGNPLVEAVPDRSPNLLVKDNPKAESVADIAMPDSKNESNEAMKSHGRPPQQQMVEATKSKKRGRPPKSLPVVSNYGPVPQNCIAEQDQVDLPKRQGRFSKLSVEGSALTIEDSDLDEDIESPPIKRNKKSGKTVVKSKEIIASDEDEDEDADEGKDDNSVRTVARNDSAKPNTKTLLPQSTPPPNPIKELVTPRKPSTPHSPLHSGKMPYRVGLSKRNRIAPLLKIIRK